MANYIKARNAQEAFNEIITRLKNGVYPRCYRSCERFKLEDDSRVWDLLDGFQHNDMLELKLEKEEDGIYLVKIIAR